MNAIAEIKKQIAQVKEERVCNAKNLRIAELETFELVMQRIRLMVISGQYTPTQIASAISEFQDKLKTKIEETI